MKASNGPKLESENHEILFRAVMIHNIICCSVLFPSKEKWTMKRIEPAEY